MANKHNLEKTFKALKSHKRIPLLKNIANGLYKLDQFRIFMADNRIDNPDIWSKLNEIEKELLRD